MGNLLKVINQQNSEIIKLIGSNKESITTKELWYEEDGVRKFNCLDGPGSS
jgi:hypothetical protein